MQNQDIYLTRRYVVFDISEISGIDFSEILEDSADTIRRSVDGTKSFVKYNLPQPASISNLTTKSIEYTHDEFMTVVGSSEWTVPYQVGVIN